MSGQWRRLRLIAMAVIALGLLASAYPLAGRIAVERANRTVELIMDYDEILNLARTQGYPVEPLLVDFRTNGLTTVALAEDTLERLRADGLLGYWNGSSLAAIVLSQGAGDPEVAALATAGRLRGDYTYVLAVDQATTTRVAAEFRRRVALDAVAEIPTASGRTLLEIRRQIDTAKATGLGVRPEEYRYLASLGFRIVPRLANYPGATAADIRQELTSLAREGRASTVIFAGDEVLGYPDNLEATAQAMVDNGLTLGLIEAPLQLSMVAQSGLEDLTQKIGYRAARVYAITRKELNKLTPLEMQERWVRSAKERNIRVMYMRPFLMAGGADLRQVNIDHIRATRDELLLNNYRIGPAGVFSERHLPVWAGALIVMGIAAGGWLLLLDIVALRYRTGLALLLLALIGGLFGYLVFPGGRGDLGPQAMALGGALVFPTLGTAYPLKRWLRFKEPTRLSAAVGVAVLSLVAATAISLIGATFIGSLLSDIRYILEFSYFRGVKLVHLVPMALLSLIYLTHYGAGGTAAAAPPARGPDVSGPPRDIIREGAAFLRSAVRAKHLAVLALAAVAGYIYIGRTGSTSGLPVSSLELNMRAELERLMVARPRTKEFLVGHPSLILAAWAALRGYQPLIYLLILAGSIGQVSAVNSFEHLRTPFVFSLFRDFNGLVLGSIIGIVALFIVDPVASWLRGRLGGASSE